MITKARMKKAKERLLLEYRQINAHIARMQNISKCDFLDRWNGKKVDRRMVGSLEKLYGDAESLRFTWDQAPAPLCGGICPQIEVKVCKGWGDFSIPLMVREGERCGWDVLDASATRSAWSKIIELRRDWADKQKQAAAKVAMAASRYNKIEKLAVDMMDKLEAGRRDSLEITVLCAFGGDIYERINPFRWKEEKPEVR